MLPAKQLPAWAAIACLLMAPCSVAKGQAGGNIPTDDPKELQTAAAALSKKGNFEGA
jgi:hypothetical protein